MTIRSPHLSPTMEEGNLATWHVKVDDRVRPDNEDISSAKKVCYVGG
jgi:pyruvate/2-oxoglutarate dehydrogenase complex dihydrolipoamide acyltransferase (E2) component